MIQRAHRRYGLTEINQDVKEAWSLLLDSLYSTDRSVQDSTGVAHLSPGSSLFEDDRWTPKPIMCQVFRAWEHLLVASNSTSNQISGRIIMEEPLRYDLINLGREVLAQISTPMALNFTAATSRTPFMKWEELMQTSERYIELLHGLDKLVATDTAFLLGPWLAAARAWGRGNQDCPSSSSSSLTGTFLEGTDCSDFYEWNARTQLTTWNPVSSEDTKIPGGPIDYAAKHWSGLIKNYYARRAELLLDQALLDERDGSSLNQTAVAQIFAQHANQWTTRVSSKTVVDDNDYDAMHPIGDPLEVSWAMHGKYKYMFDSC